MLPPAFTRDEISYLRNELLPRFGTSPLISEGILLRSWKAGSRAGDPRLPPAVKTLAERGLIEVRRPSPGQPYRAFWTDPGLRALAQSLRDVRIFDPDRYGDVIAQLAGLPPPHGAIE